MTDGSAVVLLLRMTVSLAVVLGLIVWAARVLNRRARGRGGRAQRQIPITVLGRQSLTRHAGLSVVQVGEEILVLGITDTEVNLLTTVDPATLPAESLQDAPSAGSASHPQSSDLNAGAAAPSFVEALRLATNRTLGREVQRQDAGARAIADRVVEQAGRQGGRHRG